MRFSKYDVVNLNITWFAVDRIGQIAALTSGFYGDIPEFVCKSKENASIIEKYFVTEAQHITEIKMIKGEEIESFSDYSKKGVFCFDAYNGIDHTSYYTKVMSPKKSLLISELPENISGLLSNNFLDINFNSTDTIEIENAYDLYGITLKNFALSMIQGQDITKYFLNDIISKFDFKKKSHIRQIYRMLKNKKVVSLAELSSIDGISEHTKKVKGYFEIVTTEGIFVLYLVHTSDIIICGKGGLYSLQLYKKDNVIFDFNDKPGVWVEV